MSRKQATYRCPVVFPEHVLVDIVKKLLFKLKNNLNEDRKDAAINTAVPSPEAYRLTLDLKVHSKSGA